MSSIESEEPGAVEKLASFVKLCLKFEQDDLSVESVEWIRWFRWYQKDTADVATLLVDYNDEYFARFGHVLARNTKLLSLKMRAGKWNQVSAIGAEGLAQGICQSGCQSLELSGDYRSNQDDRLRDIIPQALYGGLILSTSLRDLTIQRSVMIDMKALVPLILSTTLPRSEMTNLTINHHCIHLEPLEILESPLTTNDLRLLSSSLRGSHSLHTLTLANCRVDDEGAVALCEHLSENQTLECLKLRHNLFGPNGVQTIMRTIAKHPTLWELDLSANRALSFPGVIVIGAELPNINIGILKCESCCFDTMSDPSVTDEACQALANGLRQNSSLRELFLSDNFISGTGMKAITTGLANHPTMEKLSLSTTFAVKGESAANSVGLEVGDLCLEELYLGTTMTRMDDTDDSPERCRDAIESLAAGIRNNESLRLLDFSCNWLSPAEVQLLVRAIVDHPFMEKLVLIGNSAIGFDGLTRIADELPNLTLQEICLTFFYRQRRQSFMTEEDKMTVTEKADAVRAGQALVRGIKTNFTLSRLDLVDPIDGHEWQILIKEYLDEVDFYLKLNNSGRYLMRNDYVPTALWPHVMEHNNDNLSHMYYFLREQPWLVQTSQP